MNLYRIIKKEKPDIVQTWMHHSDLLGGIIAKFAGVKKIFWNLRIAELNSSIKLNTRLIIKICTLLSYIIPL